MDLKVYLEIPEGSNLKYELDETSHQLTLDRILPVSMTYPVNYGLVKDTVGEDGDALDALVFLSYPTVPGIVVTCKPLGLLEMEDEEGIDHKVICVPKSPKIDPVCGQWQSLADIPESKKAAIRHFFEHYKDLEPEKWVKLKDWQDVSFAEKIIQAAQKRQ